VRIASWRKFGESLCAAMGNPLPIPYGGLDSGFTPGEDVSVVKSGGADPERTVDSVSRAVETKLSGVVVSDIRFSCGMWLWGRVFCWEDEVGDES
jgi:hypothetical protein